MCTIVYLGSDVELRTLPWDEARPALFVDEIVDQEAPVRRHFSKPRVYRVGCFTGCGCGFQYGQHPEMEAEPDELAASENARAELLQYLTEALKKQATMELYACWGGDEGEPASSSRQDKAEDLFQPQPFLVERQFVSLMGRGGPSPNDFLYN